MESRSRFIAGSGIILLLALPLGAFVHVSPRFAGSLGGSLIGIVAALLMFIAAAHALLKQLPWVERRLTRVVSKQSLLTIHICAGVFGALLALVHSAHKYESPLGVSLTGIMLLVVVTGYIGRYLLAQLRRALRARESELTMLNVRLSTKDNDKPDASDRLQLVEAIADAEYAVRSETALNALFGTSLRLHLCLSVALILLLILHVWSSIYYGLRWL